jgi:hypothetical protein
MTADDRFDEVLGQMARDYQRPPETPREEMWARIEAARRAAPRVVPGEVRVLPFAPRRRVAPWIATAVAASLVLGIAIGRISAPDRIAPAASGTLAAVAPDGSTDTTPAAAGSQGAESNAPVPHLSGSSAAVASATTEPTRLPAAAVTSLTRASTERSAPATERAPLPYRVAAGEHLIRAEALLVSLRSDLRSGRRDTTIAVWAGDLLGTTRMLLDSPAGEDRQMKRLLEDLELVLAQIARLHQATGGAADLELIDEAVRQRQVMTRLRALSPGT